MSTTVQRGALAALLAAAITALAYIPVYAFWLETCGMGWSGPKGVGIDPPARWVMLECHPIPHQAFLALVFVVTLILVMAAISLRAGDTPDNRRRKWRRMAAGALTIGLVSTGTLAINAFLRGPVIQERLGLGCEARQAILPDHPPCPLTLEQNILLALALSVLAGVVILVVSRARASVSPQPPVRTFTLVRRALIAMAITALAVSYVIVFLASLGGTLGGPLLPLVERVLK